MVTKVARLATVEINEDVELLRAVLVAARQFQDALSEFRNTVSQGDMCGARLINEGGSFRIRGKYHDSEEFISGAEVISWNADASMVLLAWRWNNQQPLRLTVCALDRSDQTVMTHVISLQEDEVEWYNRLMPM